MAKGIGIGVGIYLIIALIVGWYWSFEPEEFEVESRATSISRDLGVQVAEPTKIVGVTTTATLIAVASEMLNKSGGYISNDYFPPGLWLDNIKNWEFGVLVQVRDLSRAMRQDMSRSQSQSIEDNDLKIAEPQFSFDNKSWAIPATESEYRRGIKALESYLVRLSDRRNSHAQFYARADNLRNWLKNVETRLGSLSQRLSESVGKQQLNIDLAGDPSAKQSTEGEAYQELKTSWFEIDDIFYEARGTAWALIHILKAIEVDFKQVLIDKNALVSLQQIVLELEATQEAVWSPMILNGSGFGMLANHSLTMASYISRANAAIIDLRSLLQQG
ncbi:hypothetical protein OLMES_0981 [Oleiphilus messinensis]|uniref:DUF2333 family protein n=1 Tax=Oleiphilus messinensis TaxID=141451 RepID=A0A1Y0I3I3_9GAMM|nr:DUF2333 family protein [Oleiphilus messinensis]ARU55068.1 hypothetical protein OLMES_0981 [Oleiphilus messinensis]